MIQTLKNYWYIFVYLLISYSFVYMFLITRSHLVDKPVGEMFLMWLISPITFPVFFVVFCFTDVANFMFG